MMFLFIWIDKYRLSKKCCTPLHGNSTGIAESLYDFINQNSDLITQINVFVAIKQGVMITKQKLPNLSQSENMNTNLIRLEKENQARRYKIV